MARAHFADVLIGTSGTGALSLLDGATVHVYDQGTTNHIAQTLYAADSGGTTLSNPLTSDANGKVEFWLDTPARVDLAASKTGFSPSTRTVDVEGVPQAPSGGGSGVQVTPVTIAAADVLTLDSAHVDLVAAVPNTTVVPVHITIEVEGTTGYALDSGSFINVGWGAVSGNEPGSGKAFIAIPHTLVSGALGAVTAPAPARFAAADPRVGLPLVIGVDTALTGGDGDWKVTVAWYRSAA